MLSEHLSHEGSTLPFSVWVLAFGFSGCKPFASICDQSFSRARIEVRPEHPGVSCHEFCLLWDAFCSQPRFLLTGLTSISPCRKQSLLGFGDSSFVGAFSVSFLRLCRPASNLLKQQHRTSKTLCRLSSLLWSLPPPWLAGRCKEYTHMPKYTASTRPDQG